MALLWWNKAPWVLKNRGLAVMEDWPPVVALPRHRPEQRRERVHLKAGEHLGRASIWAVE